MPETDIGSAVASTDQHIDFSVDTVTLNTSFRLANAIATAPGVIAGAAGFDQTAHDTNVRALINGTGSQAKL